MNKYRGNSRENWKSLGGGQLHTHPRHGVLRLSDHIRHIKCRRGCRFTHSQALENKIIIVGTVYKSQTYNNNIIERVAHQPTAIDCTAFCKRLAVAWQCYAPSPARAWHIPATRTHAHMPKNQVSWHRPDMVDGCRRWLQRRITKTYFYASIDQLPHTINTIRISC